VGIRVSAQRRGKKKAELGIAVKKDQQRLCGRFSERKPIHFTWKSRQPTIPVSMRGRARRGEPTIAMDIKIKTEKTGW